MLHHEILLVREVAARLRISVGTVTRLLAKRRKGEGNFPLPISDARSKGRWRASDIDAYIASIKPISENDIKDGNQKRQAEVREGLRHFNKERSKKAQPYSK